MKFLNVMAVALLLSPVVVFPYQETNSEVSTAPYDKTVGVTTYDVNAPVQSTETQVTSSYSPSSSSADPSIKIDFTAPVFAATSSYGIPSMVKDIKDEKQRKVYIYLTAVNDAAKTSSSNMSKEFIVKNKLHFDKTKGVLEGYKKDEDIILAILNYTPWLVLYRIGARVKSVNELGLEARQEWSDYLNNVAYKILGIN